MLGFDRTKLDYAILVGCYCMQMLGCLCGTLRSKFSSTPFKSAQVHPRPLTLLRQPPHSGDSFFSRTRTRVLDVHTPHFAAQIQHRGAPASLLHAPHHAAAAVQQHASRFVVPAELAIYGQHGDADADADAAALARSGVTVAVCLRTSPPSVEAALARHGARSVPLPFDCPRGLPPAVLSAFAHTVRAAPAAGFVAVGCRDGRKGQACAALCARHLMQLHGFAAAEAAAWLRLSAPPPGT